MDPDTRSENLRLCAENNFRDGNQWTGTLLIDAADEIDHLNRCLDAVGKVYTKRLNTYTGSKWATYLPGFATEIHDTEQAALKRLSDLILSHVKE